MPGVVGGWKGHPKGLSVGTNACAKLGGLGGTAGVVSWANPPPRIHVYTPSFHEYVLVSAAVFLGM